MSNRARRRAARAPRTEWSHAERFPECEGCGQSKCFVCDGHVIALDHFALLMGEGPGGRHAVAHGHVWCVEEVIGGESGGTDV
jgi:hypothetical protein